MCPQVAMQFITMYSYEDIVTANIEGSSGSVWRISPPSRQELIKELLGTTGDMTLRLDWNFQRSVWRRKTVVLNYFCLCWQLRTSCLLCVCVWKGPGERWDSGAYFWQARHQLVTAEPSKSKSGLAAFGHPEGSCVSFVTMYGKNFIKKVILDTILM